MKKINLITTLLLVLVIVLVSVFMLFSNSSEEKGKQPLKENNIVEEKQKPHDEKSNNKEIKNDTQQKNDNKPKDTISAADKSLFIGDSRTVGLMEYSQMDKADFFCTVGMSVFNIHDDSISVPNVGKVSLTELLNRQKYDRIYIMLGVNEMGYKFEKIIEKYKELIRFIKEKEPNAAIFLQANLHVTSERSNSDDTFNNKSINRLNTALSKLANNKDIFYIDVNPLFDDENGNLSSDKSSDNTHLYAKYYETWGKWIMEQTALLTKEE